MASYTHGWDRHRADWSQWALFSISANFTEIPDAIQNVLLFIVIWTVFCSVFRFCRSLFFVQAFWSCEGLGLF